MRPSQKSNRSRGKSNRKNIGNNINRVYESAGPDGKVRGTPQQIIDKYNALARDAQTSGDRVMSENFLQHAEHYQRLLSAAQAAMQDRRDQSNGAQRPAPYDSDQGLDDGDDDDVDTEVDAEAEAETEAPAPVRASVQAPVQAPAQAPAEPPVEVGGMATFDTAEEPPLPIVTPEQESPRRAPRSRRSRGSRNGAGAAAATASEEPAAQSGPGDAAPQDAPADSVS